MSKCESDKEKDENHGGSQRRRVAVESIGHFEGRNWKIDMKNENTTWEKKRANEWLFFKSLVCTEYVIAIISSNNKEQTMAWEVLSMAFQPGPTNRDSRSTATRQKQLLKLILARGAVKSSIIFYVSTHT